MMLELRAFTQKDPKSRRIELRVDLPSLAPGSSRTWVHCAVEGEWLGHPSGPFQFTRDVFNQIIANFKADGEEKPLYYEHPRFDLGIAVPACGWIHGFEIRDTGLWADIEFLPDTAELVRLKKYRKCSVVVDFNSSDRKTGQEIGPELFNIGLTNEPFLRGLTPIELSLRAARKGKKAMADLQPTDLGGVLSGLGLPEDASEEQAIQALCALMKLKQAQAGEMPEAEPMPEMEPTEMSKTALNATPEVPVPMADPTAAPGPSGEDAQKQAIISILEQATGKDLAGIEALLRDNMAALESMAKGAPADGTKAEQSAMSANPAVQAVQLNAHKARVEALSKQLSDRDGEIASLKAEIEKHAAKGVESQVDAAVEKGVVLAKDREKLVKLGRVSPDLLGEFLNDAKASPAVPTGVIAGRSPVEAPMTDFAPQDEAEVKMLKRLSNQSKKVQETALRKYREIKEKQNGFNGRA